MKKISFIYCCIALLFSCAITAQQKNKMFKKQDQNFVGIWAVSLKSTKSPFTKSWQITRKPDGTFIKNEVWSIKGRMQKINTKGNWWTKNGSYYEKNDTEEKIERHHYQLLKGDAIKFKSPKSEKNPLEYTEQKQ